MIITHIVYVLLREISSIKYRIRLRHFGSKSQIISPLHIDGKNIYIGSNVHVNYKTWLASNPLTGEKHSELRIEDGCIIGHFNEIYATKSVVLEKNVLTADRVYISDNLHEYKDIKTPISLQPIRQNGTVKIGEGSWIGVGVSILGANVGKHCVIGANSVVTRDIPDYCIVVGIPAKIIKRYCFETETWRKTDSDGNFID